MSTQTVSQTPYGAQGCKGEQRCEIGYMNDDDQSKYLLITQKEGVLQVLDYEELTKDTYMAGKVDFKRCYTSKNYKVQDAKIPNDQQKLKTLQSSCLLNVYLFA